jgi:glycosyltransferase involved in cell wall biosynthesis
MKIRQIVPSLERQHGGPSRSVHALARAQTALGQSVELLTTASDAPPEGRETANGALRIRVLRRDPPDRICPSAGLKKALLSGACDVVHHHALWLRTLDYAHRAARAHRVPLVVSPRGMMAPWAWNHHRWRKAAAALLLHPGALRAVHGWHATSNQEAKDIAALGFHQPICVAPNGVDAPREEDLEAARRYWMARLPQPAPKRIALFYSRFHRKKRLLELLDLWASTPAPDWHLLVVGIPAEFSVAKLAGEVARRGLSGRVSVHDGTDAPPPYAAASLFLLPSHDENFGLVIAEAMAAGIPVVVTDTTPWREIQTRVVGWCVPWTDFGAALNQAVGMPAEQLRARGEAARAWVLDNFSWSKSAALLLDFYRGLRAEDNSLLRLPRSPA